MSPTSQGAESRWEQDQEHQGSGAHGQAHEAESAEKLDLNAGAESMPSVVKDVYVLSKIKTSHREVGLGFGKTKYLWGLYWLLKLWCLRKDLKDLRDKPSILLM
ncbi:hypothetical protein H0H92_011574 [Tricholoma furcatifolium]|nr:hypothetical protein H0H92_011574 [Tricholoma furcatifolium]